MNPNEKLTAEETLRELGISDSQQTVHATEEAVVNAMNIFATQETRPLLEKVEMYELALADKEKMFKEWDEGRIKKIEELEKEIRVNKLKHLKELDELNTICSAERAKIERLKIVSAESLASKDKEISVLKEGIRYSIDNSKIILEQKGMGSSVVSYLESLIK